MRRYVMWLAAIPIVAGCAAERFGFPTDVGDGIRSKTALAGSTASLLPAASESEWRRVTDAGPLKFDEVGMPVVVSPVIAKSAVKPRIFLLRFGGHPSTTRDTEYGDNFDIYEDGPLLGMSFILGPTTGLGKFEVGYDYFSIAGDDWDSYSNGFYSDCHSVRIDLHFYIGGRRSARKLFLFGGGRVVIESGELWSDSGGSLDYENSGFGWASGVGFLMGGLEIRYGHNELSGENRVGLNRVTIGYRF